MTMLHQISGKIALLATTVFVCTATLAHQHSQPDFAAAAAKLDITEQALIDALGGPEPDFSRAAASLGISEEALVDAIGTRHNNGPRGRTARSIPAAISQSDAIASGMDIKLFFEGALSGEPVIEDCTLSDGTQTQCYKVTIAGYPANHEIGPFCPPYTTSTSEEGGIWFDGNGVYEVDGDFIVGLAELYDDENWKLYEDNGAVRVTDTAEAFDGAARPNVAPEYQNHCVAGKMEWLDGGVPVQKTVYIPVAPVATVDSTESTGNLGITLNGVIIAEPAPVNAILGAYTIAVFDDCGGHLNPVEGYHLHGARGCSEVGDPAEGETPIFAYAMDGFAIHSPLDENTSDTIELDECNGHVTPELGYHYHASAVKDNAVIRCFRSAIVENEKNRH